MTITTRFAPSPTGKLHTGSARTAYFNYLFARHNNGKFLIRVEDTDKERSKDEHVKTILQDMSWLGLDHDNEIVFQAQNIDDHIAAANKMVELGHAYFCYSSKEEIEDFRKKNPNAKFQSPWRDSKETPPTDVKPVIRLKVDHSLQTTIDDLILGTVSVQNTELDDMIILRSDNTPTYNLSVVVDDHNMNVTHVIREMIILPIHLGKFKFIKLLVGKHQNSLTSH